MHAVNLQCSGHKITGYGGSGGTQRYAYLWNPKGNFLIIWIGRSVKLAFFEKVLRRLFRYIWAARGATALRDFQQGDLFPRLKNQLHGLVWEITGVSG